MSTELHLPEVLQDEYASLHGPVPPMPPWPLLVSHLTDGAAWLRKFRTPTDKLSRHLKDRWPKDVRDSLDGEWRDGVPSPELYDAVAGALDAVIRSGEPLYDAARFEHVTLSEEATALLQGAPHGEALIHLNRLLVSEAYPNEIRMFDPGAPERDRDLAWLYALIHRRPRAAICLSGGGIRSATFGLGVLQGLARHGLLDKFDYLSTVSGGGYLGSWLSAWIHRNPRGRDGVIEDLRRSPTSALDPEPPPIQHLRQYSNYLSPRFGAFSVDTWTLFATYGRNLLLNWLVLIPLLLAVLAVPRIYVAIVRWHDEARQGALAWAALGLGGLGLVMAVTYMGLFRPSLEEFRKRRGLSDWFPENRRTFLAFCLVPLLGGAVLVATWWAWLNYYNDGKVNGDEVGDGLRRLAAHADRVLAIAGTSLDGLGLDDDRVVAAAVFIGLGAGLHGAAWLVYSWLLRRWSGAELVAVVGTGALAGFLASIVATKVSHGAPVVYYPELYACFGATGILIIFLLTASVFIGLISRWTDDEDREWFARLGGWVLIGTVAWSGLSALVIFGPLLLGWLKTVVSIGTLSSLAALAAGWTAKTSATAKQREQAGALSLVMDHAAVVAAPIALVFILIILSLGTSALLAQVVPDLADTDYFQTIQNATVVDTVGFALVMAILGIAAGQFINVNQFSLHGMYRSRLIRAYLGASRLRRRPNPFTGFDPLDNVQMHELRPELLDVGSFVSLGGLVVALQTPATRAAAAVRDRLDAGTRGMVQAYRAGRPVSAALQQALTDALNEMIVAGRPLLPADVVTAPPFAASVTESYAGNPTGDQCVRLNRALLEQAFPGTIRPASSPPQRPLHVINVALNLVAGRDLARQERKAESFTVSHLHAGSWGLGYRRSSRYGSDRKPFGISLGTAVTISGAAASPNQGYHSSPVVTFLLALFNVRLGWWLGNPGPAGESTFEQAYPRRIVPPLVAEALGMTDRDHPYVYLSDGGHFDNLGMYEMALRRCRYIVVSDAGCDPDCSLEDLGGAIRKIRIDFGIPITVLREFRIYARASRKPGKYCALCTIGYSAVDGPGTDGWLIYIKPEVYGREPVDIYNYAEANPTFPHEPTADQFFTESQFESYRMLGISILDTLCRDAPAPAGLEEFVAGIARYVAADDGA